MTHVPGSNPEPRLARGGRWIGYLAVVLPLVVFLVAAGLVTSCRPHGHGRTEPREHLVHGPVRHSLRRQTLLARLEEQLRHVLAVDLEQQRVAHAHGALELHDLELCLRPAQPPRDHVQLPLPDVPRQVRQQGRRPTAPDLAAFPQVQTLEPFSGPDVDADATTAGRREAGTSAATSVHRSVSASWMAAVS